VPRTVDPIESRRRFLRFLAGSPLLAYMGWPDRVSAVAQLENTNRRIGELRRAGELISSPDEAINVFDLEAVAEKNLPPAHWGYMATGVDDDATLRANREGFTKFYVRPRRLVDVRNIDMSTEVLGTKMKTPIVIAPTGSQKAFHAEGEVAVARAARPGNHLQILSTVTTSSVEEVTEARGAPIWYQLYPTSRWSIAKGLLKRAEAAGCPVVCLTVDLPTSNRETVRRFARQDDRDCSVCHQPSLEGFVQRKPMFDGLDVAGLEFDDLDAQGLTWDFLKRLRDETSMKVVVKGVVTHEDAQRCVEYGADALIVSNHGGRAEGRGRGTIESLPEVVEAVADRIPVLVDGGFRRGTDVFTALALGASAICIGRPYLWGLGAFGQPGVERVLELLRAELEIAMKQAGTTSIGAITSSYVKKHG
jgi:isopentenyl diphosphate isomerase/L-lactate dehydrogenase-like FMN-dependent dehydrogenase